MDTRNDRSDDVVDGLNDGEKIGTEGQVYTPDATDGSVKRDGGDDEAGSVREAPDPDAEASYTDERETKKI